VCDVINLHQMAVSDGAEVCELLLAWRGHPAKLPQEPKRGSTQDEGRQETSSTKQRFYPTLTMAWGRVDMRYWIRQTPHP